MESPPHDRPKNPRGSASPRSGPERSSPGRTGKTALFVGAAVSLLAILLVALSLRRPEPPSFAPSPLEPRPAGEELVGPRTVTVDASEPDRWRHFSFVRGAVVEDPEAEGWDLAFRRFTVIANGGEAFPGAGGLLDLGPAELEEVGSVPESGYVGNRVEQGDSVNPEIERWYDYSFLTHLLTPKPHVWAVRTADGRFAVLELLGYYCPGVRPGCVTFRYLYQGAGGTRLDPAPPP